MSRNDSILATGASSANFATPKEREVKAKQQQRHDQRKEVTNELKPSAQLILEAVDQEQDKTIQRLLSLVAPGTPEKDVKSLLISLNLYKESLARIRNRLQIVLQETHHE
jgi:hypothetical protein